MSKDKCVIGYGCGLACITKTKKCQGGASEEASAVLNNFAKAAGEVSKAGKLIGKGITGRVYLVPGNKVIKVSKDDLTNEAKMLKKAHEVGIGPKFEGYSNTGGKHMLRMQYLEGYSPIFKLKLDKEAEAKIREAIDVMHRAGIAHTDLHRGNIMYNPSTKDVKIIDYGFAKDFSSMAPNHATKVLKHDLNYRDGWEVGSRQDRFLKGEIDVHEYTGIGAPKPKKREAVPEKRTKDSIDDAINKGAPLLDTAEAKSYLTPQGTVLDNIVSEDESDYRTAAKAVKIAEKAGVGPKLLGSGPYVGRSGYVETEHLDGYEDFVNTKADSKAMANLISTIEKLHKAGAAQGGGLVQGSVKINPKTGDIKIINMARAKAFEDVDSFEAKFLAKSDYYDLAYEGLLPKGSLAAMFADGDIEFEEYLKRLKSA